MKDLHLADFQQFVRLARPTYQALVRGPDCPSEETLSDYAAHQLAEYDEERIIAHVRRCTDCQACVLRLEVEQTAWETQLEQGFQDLLTDLHWQPSDAVAQLGFDWPLAEYFWDLPAAGQVLTGQTATITQEKRFETIRGPITLTCAWGAAVDAEPGFLYVGWETDLAPQGAFTLRIIDPDSQAIRLTLPPAFIQQATQHTFKQTELGFDPVRERWAIVLTMPAQS